jgi:hypothetical protein
MSAASLLWPSNAIQDSTDRGGAEGVLVATNSGATCGTITASEPGFIDLSITGSTVRLPLSRLLSIEPTNAC